MSDLRVHLVPSFHYDVEYLLAEGPYLEICFQNLLEAHRLLSTYPQYTFRVEQTYLLERFLQEYPSLSDDLRRFARQGRLEVASGMYTMADLNMPSGESIVRQLVVGKRLCGRLLGVEPFVLDAGDCTGHPAQMPQIARICGYRYYTFQRAVDNVGRKCEIIWRGIDGTEVPTYWLAVIGYAGWYDVGRDDVRVLEELLGRLNEHCLSPEGILSHGGDFKYPYERGIEVLSRWNEERETKIIYSTYGRALEAIDFSGAPVEECEWNPDRQGCYSSRIRVKQGNRECEGLLFCAEAVSALARWLLRVPPDEDGLLRAWKLTFINQFHDIIWGTVCDEAYRHALERIGRVRMICEGIIEDRLRLPAGDGEERRVVAFNPLPWPRRCWLEVPVGMPSPEDEVVGPSGSPCPAVLSGDKLSWRAELPPCGYSSFILRRVGKPETRGDGSFKVKFVETDSGYAPEVTTPLYHVEFSPGGTIASLRDLRSGKEFVDPERPAFNALCLQSDRGDLWQYYEGPLHDGGPQGFAQDLIYDPYPSGPSFTSNGKRIYLDVIDNRDGPQAEFGVEEESEWRLVLRISGSLVRRFPSFREFWNEGIRVDWSQRVVFYRDDPTVEFRLETHHVAGRWYRLRAAFFTDIRGTIYHEIQFGRFVRPEGEFAAQNYIVYYDKDKGLALFNMGLPGNNVTDGVLMLSLMRSVNIHTRAESDMAFELGERHRFRYAVLPFAGEEELGSLNLARRGAEFVVRPFLYDTAAPPPSEGFRFPPKECAPPEASLMRLEGDGSVSCTAVYPEGEVLVVRLYESEGREAEARLSFALPVESAEETDALLRDGRRVPVDGSTVKLRFRPFEIKTLVLKLKGR